MMELYMVKEIISDYINVVVEKTFVITVMSSIFIRNSVYVIGIIYADTRDYLGCMV